MTSRSERRTQLGRELDSLLGDVRARDAEPVPDLDRLTQAERELYEQHSARVRTLAAAAVEPGTDPDDAMQAALAQFCHYEVAELRALQRKAIGETLDSNDVRYLDAIEEGTREAGLTESNWFAEHKRKLHAGIPVDPDRYYGEELWRKIQQSQ